METSKPSLEREDITSFHDRVRSIPDLAPVIETVARVQEVAEVVSAVSTSRSTSPRFGTVYYGSVTRMI